MASAIEMTEPEAMASYMGHLKAHKCRADHCDTAWKLHDQWKRAEARQYGPLSLSGARRRGGPLQAGR
jgi:hypothetical protein